MAERPGPATAARPATAAPRPLWRKRRFWHLVIVVELVAALAVSYLVEGADEGAQDPVSLPSVTSGGT